MGQNFLPVDREQLYLMPPSVGDWLPEDHFAWFIVDVVAALELSSFVAAYRDDGRGSAAYHPVVMSRCCSTPTAAASDRAGASSADVTKTSATAWSPPTTIPTTPPSPASASATKRPSGGLFAQVLGLCADAGLIRPEVVAIDGTRMGAIASELANRTAEELAAEVLAEAEATDVAEDARHGAARGDELPPSWAGRGGRRERVREALRQLEADHAKKSVEAELARRAEIEAETGRKLRGRQPTAGGRRRKPRSGQTVTDPDSRLLKTAGGFIQGYNAQAAVTADQVVVAADVTNQSHDQDQFEPMITTGRPTWPRPR
jgi:transposase